jgi:hypothetical protein
VRVVTAPDSFGGTLAATVAAEAIAVGWRRAAPDDDLALLPVADGGTGFVDVLHTALGGTLHDATVTGPFGDPVPAAWLRVGDTAYLESAAAWGLHLVATKRWPPSTPRSRPSPTCSPPLSAQMCATSRVPGPVPVVGRAVPWHGSRGRGREVPSVPGPIMGASKPGNTSRSARRWESHDRREHRVSRQPG